MANLISKPDKRCSNKPEKMYTNFTEDPKRVFDIFYNLVEICKEGKLDYKISTVAGVCWPELFGSIPNVKEIYTYDINPNQIGFRSTNYPFAIEVAGNELRRIFLDQFKISFEKIKQTLKLDIFLGYKQLPKGSLLFMSNIPDYVRGDQFKTAEQKLIEFFMNACQHFKSIVFTIHPSMFWKEGVAEYDQVIEELARKGLHVYQSGLTDNLLVLITAYSEVAQEFDRGRIKLNDYPLVKTAQLAEC